MIVKWNSDINDGGKWLCRKVSQAPPGPPGPGAAVFTSETWGRPREWDVKEDDESRAGPGAPGLPPAGPGRHLQRPRWSARSACSACNTRGRAGTQGGQVSARPPGAPRGRNLRQPSYSIFPARGRPQGRSWSHSARLTQHKHSGTKYPFWNVLSPLKSTSTWAFVTLVNGHSSLI